MNRTPPALSDRDDLDKVLRVLKDTPAIDRELLAFAAPMKRSKNMAMWWTWFSPTNITPAMFLIWVGDRWNEVVIPGFDYCVVEKHIG